MHIIIENTCMCKALEWFFLLQFSCILILKSFSSPHYKYITNEHYTNQHICKHESHVFNEEYYVYVYTIKYVQFKRWVDA